MVTFNELRIDTNNERFIIDCRIDTSIYTEGRISSFSIVSYDNISPTGAIIDNNKVFSSGELTPAPSSLRSVVELNACAEILDIDTFKGGLFVVRVNCIYEDTVEIEETDTALVPDLEMIYKAGMSYAASIAEYGIGSCNPQSAFQHYILIWFAMRFAVETCDYGKIQALWKKFLSIYGGSNEPAAPCPCE